MKFVIVFVALFAVCAAAPAGNDVAATAVRDTRANNGLDKYDFDFETSSGIQRQEHGVLQKFGENSAIVVNGVASWTSPEGIVVEMKFTADENGYHPILLNIKQGHKFLRNHSVISYHNAYLQPNLKMKFIIVFVALVSVALAASPISSDPRSAEVLRYENTNIGVEGYNYALETSDGKSVSEEAVLKNNGKDGESLSVHGKYSYVGPDGVTYEVEYIADENGYQPQGAHLPK
ncbi:uncharacterized protein LOC129945159 [Eupeodes corollae]|uniref:uncharacterized protein LOC129945159 n=1 Tax=Eupeodes corollae TaxID=290404 RepID=UPI00248F7EB5|nr:uncharacterized protein LOC129945159 [Eupeodes corollae]